MYIFFDIFMKLVCVCLYVLFRLNKPVFIHLIYNIHLYYEQIIENYGLQL